MKPEASAVFQGGYYGWIVSRDLRRQSVNVTRFEEGECVDIGVFGVGLFEGEWRRILEGRIGGWVGDGGDWTLFFSFFFFLFFVSVVTSCYTNAG